jgi:molybdopterin/thiamine biosynthesis adenylyltransferase
VDYRYIRHADLLGADLWRRLRTLRVLVAGAGGLGTHVLDLLVRMAPLRLELWDPGLLDEPDLNRQCLYTPADLGAPKTDAARRRLAQINPDAEVRIHPEAVGPDTVAGLDFGGVDVCFDCLDSFAARSDLEKAVLRIRERTGGTAIPLFHGGVSGFFGQTATLLPPEYGYARVFGPEFARMVADPKPVFPPAVAMVAALQTSALIAWLRSGGKVAFGALTLVDAAGNSFDRIDVQ